MKTCRKALLALVALAPLAAPPVRAEIVLLKNGQRLEGKIVITYDRGVLFREKETAPGRYYPYEEVSRIATPDGLLYYLMPRSAARRPKAKAGFYPLARVLLPRGRQAAPIPHLEPPQGAPVRVVCVRARDAVTVELRGGGTVRLLGLAPPPASAGRGPGRAAERYLSRRVKGREALLFPGSQGGSDRDEPQAYVLVDGVFLNGEMLEKGMACADPGAPAHRYREAFDSLQRYARNLEAGMWARRR